MIINQKPRKAARPYRGKINNKQTHYNLNTCNGQEASIIVKGLVWRNFLLPPAASDILDDSKRKNYVFK
jgi:hypothetical protein